MIERIVSILILHDQFFFFYGEFQTYYSYFVSVVNFSNVFCRTRKNVRCAAGSKDDPYYFAFKRCDVHLTTSG